MKAKAKWYNDLQVVGTMLIFWPPLGLYGIYKSDNVERKYKYVTYGIFAFVACLLMIKIFLF